LPRSTAHQVLSARAASWIFGCRGRGGGWVALQFEWWQTGRRDGPCMETDGE